MNGEIEAVKLLMRIRKLGKQNDAIRAESLRAAMINSGFDGFVYDTRLDFESDNIWTTHSSIGI
jgi:hypothetical protein